MGRIKVKDYEGKITTPFDIALHMVDKLFRNSIPKPTSRVLDAGCGSGVFIEAIITWCKRQSVEPPEIVGIEIDSHLVEQAHRKFVSISKVKIVQGDFLIVSEHELGSKFDYIISNPPYISYERLNPMKRELYRRIFKVAVGRFDTYMLFFEKALELLKPGGRLVFITPEKFLYVVSARNLRSLLAEYAIEEIELIREDAFRGVLAYPTITVIRKEAPITPTVVKLRDGTVIKIMLSRDGSPWLAKTQVHKVFSTVTIQRYRYKLKDIAVRISAGVATGRDDIFIVPRASLPEELEAYAYPTISGNELSSFRLGETIDYSKLRYVMLVPYDRNGRLLSEEEARFLINYLLRWRPILETRYVVKSGKKKWYAFHENPPLKDILKPKILWRDIAREPAFYVDAEGKIIPRHTIYYLVPRNPDIIPKLIKYLNSDEVREWLKVHCQRAANGYLRLQSHILKELPIPEDIFLESTLQNKGGLEQ